MVLDLLPQILIGFVSIAAVIIGAEIAVGKMQAVAKHYGISEVVIAMTLISVGTSLPEIALHAVGSFNILVDPLKMQEISATVLGMNIGSDVIQQTLIMGSVVVIGSMIGGRDNLVFTKKFLKRDYIPMIGAHVLLLLMAFNRTLSRIEGLTLIAIFASYMYYLYTTRDEKLLRQGDAQPSEKPWKDLIIGLFSLGVLIYASDVFLEVVEAVITQTGISGSMIGVVVVGFVSAMPELVTALSAIRSGAEGISLGTLIGSNITNPLMAVGIGATISSYSVPEPIVLWDLPMQTVTAVFIVVYLWNKEKIGDILAKPLFVIGLEKSAEKMKSTENGVLTATGGLLLIGVYLLYISVRAVFFSVDFA